MSRILSHLRSISRKHRINLIVTALCLLAFGLGLTLAAKQAGVFAAGAWFQSPPTSPDGVWQEVSARQTSLRANSVASPGQQGKTFKLDRNAMGLTLSRAPREFTIPVKNSSVIVSLPLADGKFARFRVVESNILDPELAKQFPEIKSYAGQGVDDPTATVRFGWSQRGLSAMIIGNNYKATVLPPDARDAATYVSSFGGDEQDFACGVQAIAAAPAPRVVKTAVGTQLRIYRAAIATSAGYLNDPQLGGGSIANAVASINSWLNAANAIYERELSVRLTLVNNTAIIGLPTNQITNTSESTALGQIPPILGAMVGSASYDIGHVLISQGGGGIATLGGVCDGTNQAAPRKGAGATSLSGPVGNAGSTGVLVHEFGHMFGAPHTFNGTIGQFCNNSRSGSSAYEPGSGTTNMSYGGLCSQGAATDNLSGTENTRFHNRSFTAMANYIASGGSCAALQPTGNQAPNVNGGGDFTIPANTPFALTAAGSDPDAADAASLTYNWEQIDAGGAPCPGPNCFAQNGTAASYSDAGDGPSTTRPIFRPFASTANPTRFFPSLTYILNNANVPPAMTGTTFTAENLPAIGRTLNFSVTVRDNRAVGGGISDDTVKLTVDGNSGPFAVTAPNTAITWTAGGTENVTWDVNNTNAAPVNAANVKISLSTDGGQTFPLVLLATTANDGSATVTVPAGLNTSTARIKIAAVGNIFFDISDANFTINGGAGCPAVASVLPSAGAAGTAVTITGTGFTGVTALKFSNNVTATPTVVNDTTITTTVPAGAVSGPITLTKGGCGDTLTSSFTICANVVTGRVDTNPGGWGGSGTSDSYFVNRITPTSYPATLSQVQVRVNDFFAPPVGTPLTIIAAANPGGTANINNLSFQSVAATVTAVGQFNTYGVAPLTITQGDFVVGFILAPGNFGGQIAQDAGPSANRSYTSSNGNSFTLETDPGNYGIRAVYVTGCTAANCVTVTNAAPASGAPGTPVTITGTGFIGVTAVRFGGGVTAQFTINSDTSITATVPAGATTGAITVSRPGCADAQTASFTVSAGACPTVTGIGPMTAMPGSTVTITGSGLLGVSVIKFGGNTGATFTVVNDTTITATVPAGAQPGTLTLSKAGCANVTTTASFEPCGTPLLLQVDDNDPDTASSGQSYSVNRLTPVGYPAVLSSVSVRFDSFQQVPVNSPITIVAGANPGGTGSFNNITFETVNTTISALGSFITVPLTNPVTINSGDFVIGYRLTTGNFKVLLDTDAPQGRSYSSSNGTTFTAITNGNAFIRGQYSLSCAAPANPCPTVANISPTNSAAGATVTITGANFTGVTAVKFSNDVPAASFNVVNATTITAVVPAAAVTGPLTVIKPSCADAQTASFTVNQPVACQTVANISPNNGQANTAVMISGTNLAGVTDVIFTNGQSAQFTVDSNTMITATVPVGAMTGPITLKKPACADVQTATFTINAAICPAVTGYTPQTGAAGQQVTITGTGFTNMTTVAFSANANATVIFDSDTQIRAVVPVTAVTGPVKVGQPNCPDAQAGTFTVTVPCPTADSLTPTGASVGDTVTITGTNLLGVTGVKFNGGALGGGVAATFNVVNAVTITATVPAGAATGPITIEKTGCADADSPQFTVIGPVNCPTVAAINPALSAIGSTVTLTGTNFTGVTEVNFVGVDQPSIPATSFTVVNDTTITAVVPPNSGFGPITVKKPTCTDAGSTDFLPCGSTVIAYVEDGQPEATQGNATHFINRITPGAYPATLTAIDIRFDANQNVPQGTNFTLLAAGHPNGLADINNTTFQTKAVQVGALGGFVLYTLDTPITINSGDFLVGFTGVTVGTPGLVDTTTPQGRSYISQDGANFFELAGNPGPNLLIDARVNVSCTLVVCPIVAGFTPTNGGFGTGVVITGTDFTGVTAVKFSNNVDAANFTIMSNTEISAFVPATAVTGPITLIKPGCPDTLTGIFVICPSIAITPGVLTAGTVGSPYSATLTATPALAAPNWSITAGALPSGLAINQFTGELSGTPTQAGTFMFTVTYGEAFNPCNGSQSYTVTINPAGGCPTITLSPPGLLPGKVGTAYVGSLSAQGGAAQQGIVMATFTLMGGSLPPGLTLAADGTISGTPTTAGTFAGIVIKATEPGPCSGMATYSMIINPGACPDIKVGEFFQTPAGAVGTAYNATIPVDPPGSYTFTVAGGTLPAGLSLNTGSGEITGTPTTAGGGLVFITATTGGCAGGNTFSIEICPEITITPAALTAGAVAVPYNQQLTSTPAADPVFGGWEVVVPGTGTLPPGLTLSQQGLLSGDPTMAGTFPFTVEVLIGGQCRTQKNYTLAINAGTCPTITVNPATLTAGNEGVAYNATISATPAAAYTFSVTAGALPAGLTLSTAGVISGTTTATGTFTFTVRATNANQCTGERQYSLVVNRVCPTILIDSPTDATLPAGTMGTAYTAQTFTQTGTAGAITWSISSGMLPGGITLNPTTGVLSGTPTMTGNFTFTVRATNASQCTGQRQYLLTVVQGACPTITVNPSNPVLTAGTVGTAYTQAFTQVNGAGTILWSVSAGTLPGGLTLNSSSGVLSGNPTTAATSTFTIQAKDANNCTGSREYTLTINPIGNGLQFYPLPRPVRLLDTRANQGNCDNVTTPIAAGGTITTLARITCEGITIPPTAQAIVGNITVLNATGDSGFLTIYPAGLPLPLAANMIYGPGAILANGFTVGLSATGEFNIFGERTIDVVVDISGYYAPPQPAGLYYHPLSKPIRLLDTRAGFGNCDNISAPIPAGTSLTTLARTTCEGLTIPAAAQAIVGNATVINGSGQVGYLTIYPNGVPVPLAANLIYFPGQILSNAFTVSLNANGEFNIFGEKTIDMVLDIAGYYSTEANDVNGAGLSFTPLVRPLRIMDTRGNQGNCDNVASPIAAGTSISVPARLTCEGITIPAAAQTVIGTVTVINPNPIAGYMTMYPDGVPQPLTANMIYFPGQILSNAFAVGLNTTTGQFRIFGERTIEAIVDVSGYFAP